MLEYQIVTNFIYRTSSNFVTISRINYWDQRNSWKNIWKFWNSPLCRNKSAPSPHHPPIPPYSMLQHIGRVATPKLVPTNCPRYLEITLMMGGGGLVSEFMWGIVGLDMSTNIVNMQSVSVWWCFYVSSNA